MERKNKSPEELARKILNESSLPKCFWDDAVSTTCYVMNCVLIRPILKKTPYELLNGRKPQIGYLKVFGCRCYILNNGKENLGKFDAKADKGTFLGYSLFSHAYRVYNKKLMIVEESMHVVFYETNKSEQGLAKDNNVAYEHNIFLKNLENNTKIQPVDSAKQAIENMQQMDVKSAFLNGIVNEEIYVSQPLGFEDHQYPNHLYKMKKALYDLKKAPMQWYERISFFFYMINMKEGRLIKLCSLRNLILL